MSEEITKIEKIEIEFEKERNIFTVKLRELISKLNSIEDLSDAQVLMLSYRHIFVDRIVFYKNTYFKKNSRIKTLRVKKFIEYKTNHSIRLKDSEINNHIDSDLSTQLLELDFINNQTKFFEESVSTLDKMGFVIKNKIQIEEFKINNF